MTQPHHRKLRTILLTLGGNDFTNQVRSARTTNNTGDGERFPTYAPAGEFIEPSEPEWALELNFYSDWRSAGISDYLSANNHAEVAFVHQQHVGVTGETVQYAGTVILKAPSLGGEARTQDMTEVTLQIPGEPVYTRI